MTTQHNTQQPDLKSELNRITQSSKKSFKDKFYHNLLVITKSYIEQLIALNKNQKEITLLFPADKALFNAYLTKPFKTDPKRKLPIEEEARVSQTKWLMLYSLKLFMSDLLSEIKQSVKGKVLIQKTDKSMQIKGRPIIINGVLTTANDFWLPIYQITITTDSNSEKENYHD